MNQRLQPIEDAFEHLQDNGRKRLAELQHLLLELVKQLDDKPERYPIDLDRA